MAPSNDGATMHTAAHPHESAPAALGRLAPPAEAVCLPPLTRAQRREVCIHEAAHGVIHALGGAWVYRLAVAPEGATAWRTADRKGREMADLWGVCEMSGCSAAGLFVRHDEYGGLAADRRGFKEMARVFGALHPRAPAEMRRQIRAHVCGALAGPAAEHLLADAQGEPCLGDSCTDDDEGTAEALAWLLPQRGEFDRLAALTVQTLRRPDVWAAVLRLADALELAGELDDEALLPFLPEAVPHWPGGPRRRPAPFTLTTRGDA
jgi:hypothetical protein